MSVNKMIGARGICVKPTPLLDVREVAAILKIGVRTVHRLVDLGRLPRPLKIGHSSRWPETMIAEFISGGAQPVRPSVTRKKGGV